jgi:hypothetical protein
MTTDYAGLFDRLAISRPALCQSGIRLADVTAVAGIGLLLESEDCVTLQRLIWF